MASSLKQLKSKWKELQDASVLFFASTDPQLLRAAERWVCARWAEEGDTDPTRFDGPVPDIGGVIAAAGAISLFGGLRHVVLREVAPASMSDADVKELQTLFGDLENAVLLVTALYKDKRSATGKKAKALLAAAGQAGFADELTPPSRAENLAFLQEAAAQCGARFGKGAAEALLERAGEDSALLQNETEKLAAMAGYGEIDLRMVEKYGARNVEADVFALLRLITAGRRGAAQEKLAELFALRHEPIAVAGALGGSFVDMLRVRTGAEARRGTGEVFKDMGYTGSEYRLQKAKENAARYSTAALEKGVLSLAALDLALKSSALPDKGILVQAAVEELILLREGV